MPPRPFARPLPERRPPRQNGHIFQEAPQVLGHFLRCAVTLLGRLGDRFEDDGLQIGRDGGIEAARRRRLLRGKLVQQFLAILAGEGRFQRQQFVERHAKGVNVTALITSNSLALLRGHIEGSTNSIAREFPSGSS